MAGPAARTARCAAPGRCPPTDYVAYHDEEWGRPVHGDDALFERLCLEAFQSGLSWITILRRRAGFRAAFADFGIAAVAEFTDADRERLLADAGIIRNRAKIDATLANARVLAGWAPGELDELIWSHAPDPAGRPAPQHRSPTSPRSPPSRRRCRRRSRSAASASSGPTTAYALMQACGLVNDHLATCVRDAPADGRRCARRGERAGPASCARAGRRGSAAQVLRLLLLDERLHRDRVVLRGARPASGARPPSPGSRPASGPRP